MVKDYAKKSKPKKGASQFEQQDGRQAIPAWTWLIAGLIIGLIISLILYLQITSTKTEAPAVIVKQKPSAESRYKAVPAEESKSSDFSFHDVLKNKVVETPEKREPITSKLLTDKQYIMQCGSFKKKTLAESLKAKIALNGFTAKIKPTIEKSGTQWFRVSLGPYKSKRQAESERHQLQRNNINTCKIW